MKNSALIKGTAAIAVGAALLLGGGGTLASWNASDSATPGTVVAGDLDVAAATGAWKDRNGDPIDNIDDYTVVPGDKLTYTQVLDVTLSGDKMAANITATGATPENGFTPANVVVTAPALTLGDTGAGAAVVNPLKTSQKVTATITFEFKSSTTGQADVNAEYDFKSVSFNLNQITQSGLL